MRTVRQLLGKEADSTAVQQRIQEAYRTVFEGRGSQDDADIVLADILQFSGYYITTQASDADGVVKFCEGQRSVAAHVIWMLDIPIVDLRSIAKAAARGETQ